MPALQIVTPDAPPAQPPAPPAPHRRKKRETPHLEAGEIDRLFRAIHSPRDRAIFRVAYHAGLRASEIGLLELRDYNPRTERIMIHRLKNSNSGEHHCQREENRALRAWLKVRGSTPGVLFPSNRRSPISRYMLDKLIKKYGAEAQLPRKLCHFHILKHTCCTHLLDRGVGIADVQDWVGHVNIQSTAIYAHISNRRRQQIADELKDWR